jgi:hypothetical protein
MPSNVVEGAPVTTSSSPDSTLQLEEDLHLEITALPCFVKFLAELPGDFVSHEVEATRHLPILGNGPSYTIRKHIRGTAPGKSQVLKVLKKSISPGTTSHVTETEINSMLR